MFDVLSSCDNGFTCILEFKINVKVKKSMRGCFLVGVYLYIILKVVRISL